MCQGTLRVQLPEGDSRLQMLENLLCLLKSDSATWLNLSSTPWAVDMVLAIVCGLGLFFLLLPFLPDDPSVPPRPLGKKRNPSKYHKVKKGWSRTRKKSCTMTGRSRRTWELVEMAAPSHRDCWEGEDTDDLASVLRSHVGNLLDGSRFYQLLREDSPDEQFQPASTRTSRQPSGDRFVTASSPLVVPTPLTKRLPPLATISSPGLKTCPGPPVSPSSPSASRPPEPSMPLGRLSPQPLPLSSSPSHPPGPMASPRPLPGPSLALPRGHSSPLPLETVPPKSSPPDGSSLPCPVPGCSISGLPQCRQPPRALHRLILSNGESQGGQLIRQLPAASLDITQRQAEDFPLCSVGNMLESVGKQQDPITPPPFWERAGKAEQLPVLKQPFSPKALGAHVQQKCSQFFWGLPILHSESLMDTIGVDASVEFTPIFFNGLCNNIPAPIQGHGPQRLLSSQPLVQRAAQSQTLTPTLPSSRPPPVSQKQTQDRVASLPIVPCPSPPARARAVSWPVNEKRKQCPISSTIQHLQQKLLKEVEGNRAVVPPVVETPQNVFSHPTHKHRACQEKESALSFPADAILPEPREELKQHLQKRCECGKATKIHRSLSSAELRQKHAGTRQAEESCEPFQTGGRTCMGAEHPSLTVGHARSFPPGNSCTLRDTSKPSVKHPEHSRIIQARASLLHLGTRQVLEAHMKRLRVRHRWGLALKLIKIICVLKRKRVLPQPASSSSARGHSAADSTGQNINFLGEPSQTVPGEKVKAIMAVNMQHPLTGRSLQPPQEDLFGDTCGPPGIPPPGREAKLTSRPHTYGTEGRSWPWDPVPRPGRGSLGPSSSPGMGRHEPQGSRDEPQGGSEGEMNVGSGCVRAEYIPEVVESEERPSDLRVVEGASVSSASPTPKVSPRSFRTLQSNQILPSCRISVGQHPGDSRPGTQAQSRNRTQGPATGVLLQDFATGEVLQGSASEVSHTQGLRAPQAHLHSTRGTSVGSTSPSQGIRDLLVRDRSRQEQNKTKIPKPRDPWMAKNSEFPPPAGGEGFGRPKPGKKEDRSAGGGREPPSPSTQRRESLKSSRLTRDSGTVEAQVLKITVGRILEEKMRLEHQLSVSKENFRKGKPPVDRRSSYQENTSLAPQKRRVSSMAGGQQASPEAHGHLRESRLKTDKENNPAFLPREPVRMAGHFQGKAAGPGAMAQPAHCPRHCALQKSVLPSQSHATSPISPGEKSLGRKAQGSN